MQLMDKCIQRGREQPVQKTLKENEEKPAGEGDAPVEKEEPANQQQKDYVTQETNDGK